MISFIELNEEDITKVLAEYFYTTPNNIKVEVRKEMEGQGIMEHFVYNVYATIINI